MNTIPSLETRILRRFLENAEQDKSLPVDLLDRLRDLLMREDLPTLADLEVVLEQTVGHGRTD